MASRVLDAGAFYAGVPFRSGEASLTTPEVYDEVRHTGPAPGSVEGLVGMGRLAVRAAGPAALAAARAAAAETGDAGSLSPADISVLALCAEGGSELVTDDYAVSNVAARMGVGVLPAGSAGIRRAGRWAPRCPGCGSRPRGGRECPVCGARLRRRLV